MGYTPAELQAKVALGADAIFRIAPVKSDGTLPAPTAYKELCLASEVSVGFENRTISFANFCTRGGNVEIAAGADGVIELSEMQWIADDEALIIMENAARVAGGDKTLTNSPTVAYEFLPQGAGEGKLVYRGTMGVKKWVVKAASGGTVTVDNPTITAGGLPEKGVQAA